MLLLKTPNAALEGPVTGVCSLRHVQMVALQVTAGDVYMDIFTS